MWIFAVSPNLTALQIYPLRAGICLSLLNSNHANIAIVPNGFHHAVIAEHTNSYGVNETFFFFSCAQQKIHFYKFGKKDSSFLRINAFYDGLLRRCQTGRRCIKIWQALLWVMIGWWKTLAAGSSTRDVFYYYLKTASLQPCRAESWPNTLMRQQKVKSPTKRTYLHR